MKKLKTINYIMLLASLLSCENVNNDENQQDSFTQNKNPLSDSISQANIALKFNTLYELDADFNSDGRMDKARIDERDSTIFFNLFEAGSNTPFISNDRIIFGYDQLGSEGLHYIMMSYDTTLNCIQISQEIGSARPDGFYNSWFSKKNDVWMVDSISLEMKSFTSDKVEFSSASKTLNEKLNGIDLIQAFQSIKLEKYF